MVKRYCVFASPHYYPSGGMLDYHSSYDTEEEAVAAADALNTRTQDGDWYDMEDFK